MVKETQKQQLDERGDPIGVNYRFNRRGEPVEKVTGKRTLAALYHCVGDVLAVAGAMIVTTFRGIGDIGYGLAQSHVIHERSAFNGNRPSGNSGYKPMPIRREGPFGGLTDALSRISQ